MKRQLFPTLLCLLTMHISAQQPVLNKEHNTPKTVPAGNNSGITRSEDEEDKVKTPAFLSRNELPDPTRFIAEPPQPGTGPFENDTYYYHFGKQQRNTPRGYQAALDEVQWTSKAFSEAAGFLIDPQQTPEIFKLAEGARKDAGHSVRGWVYALTLALVVPDSTEALIARAQEYAINRVICGRHYKSDIDASLIEATAVMSRLLCNAAFLEQLKKARREYARLREIITSQN